MEPELDDWWQEEWGRLTRFFRSSAIALSEAADHWERLPLARRSSVPLDFEVRARELLGDEVQKYEVTVAEHVAALRDHPLLSAMVLQQTHALVEILARAVLAKLQSAKKLPQGILDGSHPTPECLVQQQVEFWATRVLDAVGKTWADVENGGKAVLVEAAVARNIVAHGLAGISRAMINRVEAAGGTPPWSVGERVTLSYDRVERYRGAYKSYARVIGGDALKKALG